MTEHKPIEAAEWSPRDPIVAPYDGVEQIDKFYAWHEGFRAGLDWHRSLNAYHEKLRVPA